MKQFPYENYNLFVILDENVFGIYRVLTSAISILLHFRPMKITRSKWDELDIKQVCCFFSHNQQANVLLKMVCCLTFFNGSDLRNIDMVINQLHNFSTLGEKERAEETKVAREPWSLK